MKILVINAGSSSLKYQLIDMSNEEVIAKGLCERIAINGSFLTHKAHGKEYVFKQDMPNHKVAIKMVLDALVSSECGVIKSMDEIAAVGHRVVHGAEDFNTSVIIDEKVLDCLRVNSELAPLHNPANIMGIEACQAIMPRTPMVAVFDTAFHATMPEKAYLYGLAYSDYKNYRIRKYGFHGTSHMFVANQAAKYLNKPIEQLKIITCHLGNGSSITAVNNGKSVETSMGFTPLDGLPMGTRSGSLDPAIVEFLMQKTGKDVHEVLKHLNKECGMLGLSGNSSDFRDLTCDGALNNPNNKRAVDIFAYRVKKFIGEYSAVMNGCDVIVFTAGVGENTPYVRGEACKDMQYLGVELDENKNENCPRGKIVDLSKDTSKVRVLVIPTNEELVIATETKRVAKI
ncbi:MAG TPA: acetate kinase [Eubacteriales bacterium]|mgnify:CR=1 FL=1|nr:acetate kinase [Eubacteriales bacterium]